MFYKISKRKQSQLINQNRYYRLTEEDYENINARFIKKYWWIVLVVLIPLLFAGYLTITIVANKIISGILEKEVVKNKFYEYKDELIYETKKDIEKTKDSTLKMINEIKQNTINNLKLYSSIPYQIFDDGMILFDSTGKSKIIQYGDGYTNTEIKFKFSFSKEPIVIATLTDKNEKFIKNKYRIQGFDNTPLFNIIVNKQSFVAEYILDYKYNVNNNKNLSINWIAIGE